MALGRKRDSGEPLTVTRTPGFFESVFTPVKVKQNRLWKVCINVRFEKKGRVTWMEVGHQGVLP